MEDSRQDSVIFTAIISCMHIGLVLCGNRLVIVLFIINHLSVYWVIGAIVSSRKSAAYAQRHANVSQRQFAGKHLWHFSAGPRPLAAVAESPPVPWHACVHAKTSPTRRCSLLTLRIRSKWRGQGAINLWAFSWWRPTFVELQQEEDNQHWRLTADDAAETSLKRWHDLFSSEQLNCLFAAARV